MESPPDRPGDGRLPQGARMVLAMVRLHPRPFIVAVIGAAIFATCTVLSSVAVQWVTDNVILPRFDEGEVATSTVVAGVVFLGAVGVVRAGGVVMRRVFAGITQFRVGATLSSERRSIDSFASRSRGTSAGPTVTSSAGPASTPTRRSPCSHRSRTPPARC